MVREIFKIDLRLRDQPVFMWQSARISNVFNTLRSNINDIIRVSFKLFIFFYDKILHAQKTLKKYKAQKALKAQKHNQTKAQKRKQANKN